MDVTKTLLSLKNYETKKIGRKYSWQVVVIQFNYRRNTGGNSVLKN